MRTPPLAFARHRTFCAFVAACVVLVLLAPAHAGSAEEPEVTDDAADQSVERGPLVVPTDEDDFEDIDILAAWVQTSDAVGTVDLLVQTTAPPQAGAVFTITVRVDPGPDPLPGSTADGTSTTYTVELTEALPDAILLVATDPTEQLVTGGDLVTIESVTSRRSDPGAEELPITQDDQTGSDEAGPAEAPFAVPRIPVQPGAQLSVVRIDGRMLDPDTRSGEDGQLVYDRTVPLNATLRLVNTGTDPDTFSLAAEHGTLSVAEVMLDPGASVEVVWSVPAGAVAGNASTVSLSSQRGAEARLSLSFAPPGPSRIPVPSHLTPLSPVAVALGFDHAFGDLAELVLLALFVLLAVLLLFWSATFARRPPPVPPQRSARPGSEALHAATRDLRETTAAPAPRAPAPTHSAPARARPTLSGRLDEIRRGVDGLGSGAKRLVVRLEDIRHDPEDPRPGQQVTTSARVRNAGDAVARLRIVVQVDGDDVRDETVTLGPGQTRPVRLLWTSLDGGGDIRLQVYDAS